MFIKLKEDSYVNVNSITWITTTLLDGMECIQIGFIGGDMQTVQYKFISDRDTVFKNILLAKNGQK